MSNLIKAIKKAFTWSVVSTTVMWSVGVSALMPVSAVAAECPSLDPGEMVKVVVAGEKPNSRPAIYSLNNNLELLPFPDGDVFKSWNIDNTYKGKYTEITDECFMTLKSPAAQPLFTNYRPGSNVVHRQSSDALFAVLPDNTLSSITQAAAAGLYGSDFKAMEVLVQHWGAYVNEGTAITEAKVHSGMLVENGGKTWYVDGSMKREVTAAGMTANRFKPAFVRPVTDAMVAGLAAGDVIDGEVKALTDRSQGGGVAAPSTPTPDGTLSVSLAADNPAAMTIVADNAGTSNGAQAFIPVLKLNFAAGSDGDVTVTNLVLTRGGVSADTDISNMYLYNGGTLLASNPSVSNNLITFSNSAGLFKVAKGSTMGVTAKLDLTNSTASGKTFTFSLASSGNVTPAPSSGTYPMSSNVFTTAAVTDLGKLAFSNVTPTAAGTVDPGTTGFEVWRFKATNTNQDTEVRKLRITFVGSINKEDLANCSLWDGATQVGDTQAALDADKAVHFNLMNKPFLVTKGQVKNLSLQCDVVGGTNRTFHASIQNGYDVETYDKNYGVYVKTNGTDTYTIIQAGGTTAVDYTINTGTLTQTVAADSPSGNIPDGATSVVLGKFLWKANGENIKVSSLAVSSTSSDITNSLANVRLKVNGSQVGTTIATLLADGATNTGWGTFGNNFIIKAGTTAEVTIEADTTNSSVAAGETFVVGTSAGSSNAQGTVSLTNISSVEKNSNTVTVRAGTVSVSSNQSFGNKSATNPTGTVNAQNVRVGSFVITAGSGENVNLTQITLQDNSTTDGQCIGDLMQNLTVKDASGNQLGAVQSAPSGTCSTRNSYTYNLSPAVLINNGSQYQVDVFGDLTTAFTTANTAIVRVNTVTANGVDTGQDASPASAPNTALQNHYVAASGAFTVEVDADTPVSNNYLMGAGDQTVAKFKVSASSTEAVTITQLVVSSHFATSSATGTMKNIRLVDDATGTQIGTTVAAFDDSVAGTSSPTGTYSHATFSNLSLKIPKGANKTLALKVDFQSYENGGFSTTGQALAPVILGGYNSSLTNPVTAVGADSGVSITATIGETNANSIFTASRGAYAATSTLHRAKLTAAYASDTPSGAASPSASQTVMKLVVTNQANAGGYSATINFFNVDMSTTISQAAATTDADRTLTIYKDSLSSTSLASTAFDNTTNGHAQQFGRTRITDANFTDVEISSGASKTFYVTLDTTDAASTNTLSVRIDNNFISWTDGVLGASAITAMDNLLPLQYKTFTY